ncbi:MAG: aldose 1-epimerase family protein [Solirubrobacteraceae bacterium]
MSVRPTGEQIEITLGEQRVAVVEVGAGLRAYSVGDRAILDGYEADEPCDGARGQALIPWPNRVRDGRYEWEGQSQQLDISEPVTGNASHGLLRWRNWRMRTRESSRVVMEETLHPAPGYPFTLDATLIYELTDAGLTVTAEVTNAGDRACPYGVGFHPYLRPPGALLIDSVLLTVPAARRLINDEQLIPVASEPLAGTELDFASPRLLGDVVINDCFTDLTRDDDGRARVILESPQGGGRSVLWLDEAYPYVMVYSGDTLPVSGERRRGIGIEPMSCAPNAFGSGEGLIRLEPGQTHRARWGIETA